MRAVNIGIVPKPIPIILTCPACCARHIDVGEFASKVHHTHACQTCGLVWRPAIVPTVGVQFLPGYKDEVDGGPSAVATLDVLGATPGTSKP
jgi:hypothetical protein